jgi:hypothetical protein
MITRVQVLASARSYLGVRWQHKGRDRNGLDCVGLLVAVSGDIGYPITDYLDYRKAPEKKPFLDAIMGQTDPGSKNLLLTGSILLLNQVLFPCHCGIVVNEPPGPTIIHASLKERKITEEPLKLFIPQIIYVREFKGIV